MYSASYLGNPKALIKVSSPIVYYIESSTGSRAEETKVIASDMPREKSHSIKLYWFPPQHNTLWLP